MCMDQTGIELESYYQCVLHLINLNHTHVRTCVVVGFITGIYMTLVASAGYIVNEHYICNLGGYYCD